MAVPILPAAVTPFDERGRLDEGAFLRLMAWFHNAGCSGVVVGGTNGEGPSLSPPERRDLAAMASRARDGLKWNAPLFIGLSTSSITDAQWTCRAAADSGLDGVLLMPPGFWKEASEEGLAAWFGQILDHSPVPVILYNFPKRSGAALSPTLLQRFSEHERLLGVKDSSGDPENLVSYRQALPAAKLYMGDERLLPEALQAGWTGSISGAANVIPGWLRQADDPAKWEMLRPVVEAVRACPQPGTHKALLCQEGILPSARLRLPLLEPDPASTAQLMKLVRAHLGGLG